MMQTGNNNQFENVKNQSVGRKTMFVNGAGQTQNENQNLGLFKAKSSGNNANLQNQYQHAQPLTNHP